MNDQAQAGRAFFERNLATIKTWAPNLHSRLAAIRNPHTEMIVDEDGGIDIGFRGRRLYGHDAVAVANAQVEDFLEKPNREFIEEPEFDVLSGVSGNFCKSLVYRMKEAGIEYDPGGGGSACHFLLFFGVGLGLHVETVVEETEARFVILIEPHIEFIYQSLFVTDWAGLQERAEARGVRFVFIVDQSPGTITGRIMHLMRSNHPGLIDGTSYFLNYRSPILDRAIELFRKELFTTVAGLGYFEDEVIMARNGTMNLAAGPAEILSDFLPPRDEPLFIVGSGPSVEKDLDFVAAHAERAVIMSIGSGLRGLLERGIYPDFNVEMENFSGNAEITEITAKEFDFKDVILIGSCTVQPRMAACYKRAIFFFREGVSATELYGGPFSVVRPSGPTVANAGLVSGIRLGFREIYLFGVDMGTKVEGKYHASGSVYGAGLRGEIARPSIAFPANFGGSATGVYIFDWSRKVLENTIRHFSEVRVYNCSDGARIEGAMPKVSRAIELKNGPVDRERLLADLDRGMTRCQPELWSKLWHEAEVREVGRAVLERFDRARAGLTESDDASADWLQGLCGAIDALNALSSPNKPFMLGTMTLAVGYASWYDRRIRDPEQRRAYRRIVAEEFGQVTGYLREHLDLLCDELEATLRGETVDFFYVKA